MNIYYVYIYYHPVKSTPVYIGKGKGGRYKDHLSHSSNKILKSKITEWKRCNLKPNVEIYQDNLSESEALTLEASLIREYGLICEGGILYNLSKGGDGVTRYDFDESFYRRLGEVNDKVLASEYGCSRSNVSHIRRGLGIDYCKDKPNYVPPPPMGGWNKIELSEDVLARLGKEPDYKIAESLGVSKTVIARRRRELSIEPYGSKPENSGRFTKGSFVRMDKSVRIFENIKDGTGFIGTKLFFSDYLGIDSNRVNELINGRIKRLCKEWIYVGDYSND